MKYDIEILDIELRKTEAGRRILAVFNAHVDEVFFLVGHHRKVMVAWQRNQGPAFISSILQSGYEADTPVQKEINGVKLSSLIRRMAAALQESGSPALCQAIGDHTALVLEWINKCDSLRQLLVELKQANVLQEHVTID